MEIGRDIILSQIHGARWIYLRLLGDVVEVITKLLYTICQNSCSMGEIPEYWRLVNMTPIYKKSQKENPENCRPVSLTFMPGKIIEQNILSEIT